jgi:hypothetical protein
VEYSHLLLELAAPVVQLAAPAEGLRSLVVLVVLVVLLRELAGCSFFVVVQLPQWKAQ